MGVGRESRWKCDGSQSAYVALFSLRSTLNQRLCFCWIPKSNRTLEIIQFTGSVLKIRKNRKVK